MRVLPVLLLLAPHVQSSPIPSEPTVTKFHVTSRIQLRYAATEVVSHVANPSMEPQEVTFQIRLPEKAFIHNFSMTVGGVEHVATVEEKEEARRTYASARQVGMGAGLVTRDTEHTALFSVATNVPPQSLVVFKLQYNELLERDKSWYTHTINLAQDKTVPDLKVEVIIEETLELSGVEVPQMIQSNEITVEEPRELREQLEQLGEKTDWRNGLSHILYQPTQEEQEEAHRQKVSGKFTVRYQVVMEEHGEIQVIDGYFVHFTEDGPDLEPLPKYTIFVLDVSGSMAGEMITQLQDAMFTVLDSMNSQDFFSIITFSYGVNVWTSPETESLRKESVDGSDDILPATRNNLDVAIAFTNSLNAGGGTNINDAMLRALQMAKEKTSSSDLPANTQAMVVFMTDGQATSGATTHSPTMKANIARENTLKLPLYCLGFGQNADFDLMKGIAEQSGAWAKRIYEGGDAAIQLENFYAQISSPVISDLSFNYIGVKETEVDIVNEEVATVLKGSSYAHAGTLVEGADVLEIQLLGEKKNGQMEKRTKIWCGVGVIPDTCIGCILPATKRPARSAAQHFMQNLHAYVHISKLLKRADKADEVGKESDEERALRLALANNFVTSVTSLVVTSADSGTTLASLGGPEEQDAPDRRASGFAGYAPSAGFQSYSSSPGFQSYMYAAPAPPPVMPRSSSFGVQRRGGPPSRSSQTKKSRGGLRGGARMSSRARGNVAMDYFQDPVTTTRHMLDDMDDMDLVPTTPVTTTTLASECHGNLTLWSSTYLRGDHMTIADDTSNLLSIGFDNKVVSLDVASCCWTLYSEPSYQGSHKMFRPGQYKSVSSLGRSLFRAVSSVRKTPCLS